MSQSLSGAAREHGTSPADMLTSIWRHRQLATQLARRELAGRYRGSWLGLAWSFLNPLLMLSIYTFVFTAVFNVKWGLVQTQSTSHFAIVLFVGLVIYGLFAECVNRAPGLVLAVPSYVKKVVFPLEVLPFAVLGSALFHLAVGLIVLFAAMTFVGQPLQFTALLLPLVLVPLVLITLGLMWLLGALGVYLRDIGQVVSLLTTGLMFLSPVFYPVSAVPERFQIIFDMNPLTVVIEGARALVIQGALPNMRGLVLQWAVGAVVAWLGFAWFQRARKGFADVL